MSNKTPHVHNWLGAPKGSELFIAVSGTTEKQLVSATVQLRIGGKPAGTFPDRVVQPGPLRIPLSTNDAYGAQVILVFGTDATATVEAFVLTPDGKHFENDDYKESFVLAQGDTTTIDFTVITIDPELVR